MGALYRLTSPSGKTYVGITTRSFEERFSHHVVEARNGSQRLICRAIRKYGAEHMQKQILVISNDWAYLCLLEQRAIKVLESKNPKGYNSTDGGEGGTGIVFSPERLAQSSRVMKEYFSRPGSREKQSAIKKAECNTKEGKARLRAVHARPEVKKKVSAKSTSNWADPEIRKRMTEAITTASNTPESRAKRSAALKLASSRPEVRARLSEMRKNRRWISKDGKLRNVPKETVEDFLSDGWVRTSPRQFSKTSVEGVAQNG